MSLTSRGPQRMVGVALRLLLVTTSARGAGEKGDETGGNAGNREDAKANEVKPEVRPHGDKLWRGGALVGFAREFTTGVSHWGVGFGGVLGTQVGRFYFDGRVQLHLGEELFARNATITYLSRYQSVTAQLSATYDVGLAGALSFRPGLALGGTLLFGGTTIGYERRGDARILFGVGPELQFVWTGTSIYYALNAQALFVPSRVAAPVLGGYLTVGKRF